jgi:glycosyltransferase involved in cell wall biosynthesis
MNKASVLVLTGALPFPLVTGAKIRTFNLLSALADQFAVELLTVITDPGERAGVETIERTGIICHTIMRRGGAGRYGRARDALEAFFGHDPYIVRHYTFADYRRRLDELLAAKRYDVIHCDALSMTGNLRGLDRNRLILTQHNIEQHIWHGYVAHARTPLARLFYQNQYRKVRRLEAALDDIYGYVVTVSEDDKRALADSYPADRIVVVENGVDPAAYRTELPVDKRSGVIFTGSLDWYPNIDGLTWFAQSIHQHIIASVPDCRVSIVGRRPASALQATLAGKPGVAVIPDVPQIQPYLHAARVMMVPLRIGGGSRLKILEAMAAGVPVVSTGKGAEGLAVTPGENIIIEDDPRQFAAAVVRLLHDDVLHAEITRRGWELVSSRYSWEQVARPLARLWNRVAGG